MDEQEIRQFIPRFVDLLRANNLGWATRQVAQSITDDDVSMLNDQEITLIFQQSQDPSTLLRELLRAVEILVVETAEMEKEIRDFFSVKRAVAHTELDEDDIQEVLLPYQDDLTIYTSNLYSQLRQSAAFDIKSLIDRLREQIQ